MNTPTSPMAHVVLKNLTNDVTPETLSEYLWLTLGLNCTPDHIRMGPPGAFNSMAFIHFSRECLAEFLRRYLEGQTFNGSTLLVEPAKRRGDGGTHHPSMPKCNRPKVLEQK